MQGRFARVLRQPGVARTVLPYLLARLPSSMILLALLLYVRDESGSFVTAGGVSAAFAVAVAVTAPALGRLVDARGQTPVLITTGLLHPLALTAVLVTTAEGAPGWVTLAAAACAGSVLPPMSACMRALWPSLLADDEQRETAFSFEALVIEACELGGPLLVGGLIAVVSPGAAVLVAAGLSGLGAVLFALSPVSRGWQPGYHSRRWRGPLAEPGVRALLAVIAASTAGLAAFEVSVAGFATGHGGAASTGTLLAVWFAGSLVGGLWFGNRSWRAPLAWQLVALLCLVALGGLLPLLATGVWSMAGLLVLAGVAIAPATAVQLTVMSSVAPGRSRTEAFTWASTANFIGIAIGSAGAGAAVEAGGVRLGLLTSAAAAFLAAGVAYAARHAFGLPRAGGEVGADEPYDLAVFNELARERDEALAALAQTGERNDELACEVAALRQRLREVGSTSVPVQPVRASRIEALPSNVTALPRRSAGA
ncbi:MAG: MFS transporter [Actinobacteria bacterium]|nr:MFS transporter [Actinomycetota bacterium]MCA1721380.1 MFS transporter [Actinomycetota bacterium]